MRGKTRYLVRGGLAVAIAAAASALFLAGPANAATAVKVPPRGITKGSTAPAPVNPFIHRVQGTPSHR